jgi:Enoyl-(Acyl carrier protein) reductase
MKSLFAAPPFRSLLQSVSRQSQAGPPRSRLNECLGDQRVHRAAVQAPRSVRRASTWFVQRLVVAKGLVVVDMAQHAAAHQVRGLLRSGRARHGVAPHQPVHDLPARRSAPVHQQAAPVLEVAAQGVRVNAVAPGPVETPMLTGFTGGSDEAKAGLLRMMPAKRGATTEKIA